MRLLLAFAVAVSLACGPATSSEEALLAGAFAVQRNGDQGTELSVTAAVDSNVCTAAGTGAVVGFSGAVGTTGAVDSVEISAQLDGGARQTLDTLVPQDFEHEGRNKTAPYSVTLSVPNGTHSVVLCFTESGSQGREPKEVCAAAVEVVVACTPPSTCSESAPFGNVVGNPNLCAGNGPPHIPVHVKGDFGEDASLTILGPGGFSHQAAIRHAGDSCVYQYNWDTAGNGGAGTYRFQVNGNGRTLEFEAQLRCK